MSIKSAMAVIASCLNFMIPKTNMIAFNSFPDLSDNSFALYEYILEHNEHHYKLVWLIGDKDIYKKMRSRSKEDYGSGYLLKNSLRGMYNFLRSKYVFFTHGLYEGIRSPSDQVVVQLFHGMPLKRCGMLDKLTPQGCQCTFAVATSEFFQTVISQAFALTEDVVLICGNPRNDLLVRSSGGLAKLGIDASSYQNIILWAPTFRQSRKDQFRCEGHMASSGLPLLTVDEICQFNQVLSALNILCLIKLHPLEKRNLENDMYSNLMLIDEDLLFDKQVQFYSVMREVDLLLTDYSSIFFDFLILDKPIVFIHEDRDDYEMGRGFLLEPIDEWTPGEKIYSFTDLIYVLQQFSRGIDRYGEYRRKVNEIVNGAFRGGSCRTLVDHIAL